MKEEKKEEEEEKKNKSRRRRRRRRRIEGPWPSPPPPSPDSSPPSPASSPPSPPSPAGNKRREYAPRKQRREDCGRLSPGFRLAAPTRSKIAAFTVDF